jgi:outer membrane protein assembly factor BamB
MAAALRRIILTVLALATAATLAVSQGTPPAKEPEPDTSADDNKALRAIGLTPDGPALLDYFRKRMLPPADPKKIEVLIRQLGDDDFTTREQAYASLAVLGAAAATGLKQFEQDPDIELRKRVLDLKHRIEVKADPAVQSAAARVIARTKPPGAADVLMAYLPLAIDTDLVNEMCRALGAVAVVDGKVEPVVLKAMEDTVAVKRGAAAEALVRAKVEAQLPAVRNLLKDADAQVRLRVAMALVPRKEKEIVPVLIDLLGEPLNADQAGPVEEVLVRLAGEKAPLVASQSSPEATRKATREAWQKWYAEHKDNIDLARLENVDLPLGYTLLVHQTLNRVVGGKFKGVQYEVMELKADKTVRWKFDAGTQAVDAQVVGENRVMLAEYQTRRITERDFKGEIKWEKQLDGNPISVQKLPNGNIFVVKNNGLAEYNRKGEEVYVFQQPQFNVVRGKKLRNGEIVYIQNQGNGLVTRMDGKNKVLQSFNVNPINSIFGGFDVLANGGFLIPDWQGRRVVEYDKDGKEVKSFNVNQFPTSALRLANGNTLVTTQNPQGRVVEFNPGGNEVWSFNPEATGTVFNARRR